MTTKHVAVVIGAILLAGCSVGQQSAAPRSESVRIVSVAVEPGGPGRLAQAPGRLSTEGNCLTLTDPDGETSLLIWPSPATTWDPTTGTVSLKGVSASIGDEVSLAGSRVTSPAGDSDYVSAPTAECARDHAFLVTGIESASD